jgi:hypothetical protein
MNSLLTFTPYWSEGDRRNWIVRLQPDRTVELRLEVVQFKQDDAFVVLGAGAAAEAATETREGFGYSVFLDKNEIALGKFGSPAGGNATAYYFWEKITNLPDHHLTLSVRFTPVVANLVIHVRVLDGDGQTVLWEKSVVDTAGLDAVLPNRAVKSLLMQPEGSAAPFIGMEMYPATGVLWCNTTNAPTGPVEVIIDNVQMLDYHVPHLEAVRTAQGVDLIWQTPLQEHIVMVADQLSGPWRPCPQLVTLSNDTLCVSMPCLGPQKFFKLVPGTRVTQDFNGSQPAWPPYYWDYGNAGLFTWTIKDGALRIECPDSVGRGDIMLLPPRSDIVVGDFSASVDILDWGSGINSRSVGIFARGVVDRDDFPGQTEGYVGELWINRNGDTGLASLNIHAGSDQPIEEVVEFELETKSGYRLVFSGVGNQLTLSLFALSYPQQPVAMTTRTANSWSGGPVGVWVGNYGKGGYDFTLDNVLVIGTNARRNRQYREDDL